MIQSACLTESISRSAGGLFPAVRELSQHLTQDAGVSVRVVSLEDGHSRADAAEWAPLAVETHRVMGPRIFGWAPTLLPALLSGPEEILHLHGLWTYTSVAANRWHRATGRPYVISVHGMLDRWAVQNSGWKKRLALTLYEARVLREAACILSLCRAETLAVRAFGLRNPVAEIPNGIDLPAREPGRPAWADLVGPSGKVLLFLGRLHPKKRVEQLLQAWGSLERDGMAERAGWWLAIVGWDQQGYGARLEDVAKKCGASRALFHGALYGPEKDACFTHASAFVLPSASEGLPMAVLEAWASGVPVLMTEACNLPQGFRADAAIGVTPEPEGIEAGMRCLMAMTDEERRAMGARGRVLARDEFSWRQIALEVRAVYEWLLGHAEQPRSIKMLEAP